jgi:cyclopropane fatty-acyl-phospholipid synthase-like methyltransferase
MNDDDRARLVDFYEQSFAIYGNDPRSVHWMDEDTQLLRFRALSRIASLEGSRVLDIGCGLGDFYRFFLKNRIDVDYTGIDIVPEFIESARMSFPDARFILGDMSTIEGEYDYIFASGVFSFVVENPKEHYFAEIKNLFNHAKKGMAFNMLDIKDHESDDTYFAYDKDEVLAYCRTLAPEVVLVDNYLPWDFTIYMYRKDQDGVI